MFRATDDLAGAAPGPILVPVPDQADRGSDDPDPASRGSGSGVETAGRASNAHRGVRQAALPRPDRGPDRRPSGRIGHDEKITVYLSPEELIDLEQARLGLRQQQGLVVDRGRLVREAISVVLEDLESRGESSTLVRRLRST